MPATLGKKLELTSLMTHDFLSVLDRETVGGVIGTLQEKKEDFLNRFAYIYVCDDAGKLSGVVRTRDLLVASAEMPIVTVMRTSVVSVSSQSLVPEVLTLFKNYSFFSVPVVDENRQLVGVIRRSD